MRYALLTFIVAIALVSGVKAASPLDLVGSDEPTVTSGRSCVNLATAIVNSNGEAISDSASTLSAPKRAVLWAAIKTWPALDKAAGAQLYANINYQSVVDVAYVLIFEEDATPIFLRCISTKRDGKWQITTFKFNTDIDQVGLPGSSGSQLGDDAPESKN